MSGCPEVEQLQRLVDDQLSAAEEQTLTAHVDTCGPCQQRLEQLTSKADLPAARVHEILDPVPSTILVERWLGAFPKEDVVGPADAAHWPLVKGYEILAELGRGGMGVVYKARQLALNRLVALKMILDGPHAGEDQLARFRREAEAVARLQHPNIVQIHDIGEQDGRPFFSMELVSGGSLARHLDGTPLNPRAAAALVGTLAHAVHAAHERGIIHRDLKPANILLAVSDQPSAFSVQERRPYPGTLRADGYLLKAVPKITDFGLAKQIVPDGRAGERTQSGTILGSPSYMSPEQAQAKPAAVGPATDVYSLGAILYELLTGRPPFRAETALDTVLQVLHEEPVPPRRLQPKLPRDLETICLTCLHKESQRRYPSARALAEDLHRFTAGEPIHARPISAGERALKWARRRPALAALLAVSVIACVILGFAEQRHRARLVLAVEEAHIERQRADDNFKKADIERKRADENHHQVLQVLGTFADPVVAYARELSGRGKHREAIDLLNPVIDKLQHLLPREESAYEWRLVANLLGSLYATRALLYMSTEKYAEARADWEHLPADFALPTADLYRSLRAVTLARLGEYQEATARAQAAAAGVGNSGDTLYFLAQACALSVSAVRGDAKLSAAERDRLADRYGTEAVELLRRAGAAGRKLNGLQMFFQDGFHPLFQRGDFQALIRALQEVQQHTSAAK